MTDNPRLFSFVGSDRGRWHVDSQQVIKGDSLPRVMAIDVLNEFAEQPPSPTSWVLRGVTSNERYVTKDEKRALKPIQPVLGRAEATCAVMIPMRKTAQWWDLSQEERRSIFHRSSHNEIGMKALPAIARRLHHCRDLVTAERYDFVTWFEFADEDRSTFDALIDSLRQTEEWEYIDQEVEFRMSLSNS